VNIKKVGGNVLLAICDAEILGKTFCQGNIVFHVKEEFYKGAKIDVEEAMMMIQNSTIVNMIGKNGGKEGGQGGLLPSWGIPRIGRVPHAQIVKL